MLLGVTLLRKKYPLAKYLCVLLIVGGVALFLYKPNKSSAVADDHIFGFGEILLVSWCCLTLRSSIFRISVTLTAPTCVFVCLFFCSWFLSRWTA